MDRDKEKNVYRFLRSERLKEDAAAGWNTPTVLDLRKLYK